MALPITFITDYGVADDFAGVCRAVIARIAPDVRVIDVTHGVARHDVREASAKPRIFDPVEDRNKGRALLPLEVRRDGGPLIAEHGHRPPRFGAIIWL